MDATVYRIPFYLLLILLHSFPLIEGNVWHAKTSAEFSNALKSSQPGDVIRLTGTSYQGDFILPNKGTNAAIEIHGNAGVGRAKTAEISGRGTGLKIEGGKWIIQNLSVEGGKVGIYVKGSGHTLQTVTASGSQQGVYIQGNSNKLQTVTAEGTAGPGIEIIGDHNSLKTVTATGRGAGVSVKGNGNQMQTVTSNPPQVINGNGNGGLNLGNVGRINSPGRGSHVTTGHVTTGHATPGHGTTGHATSGRTKPNSVHGNARPVRGRKSSGESYSNLINNSGYAEGKNNGVVIVQGKKVGGNSHGNPSGKPAVKPKGKCSFLNKWCNTKW